MTSDLLVFISPDPQQRHDSHNGVRGVGDQKPLVEAQHLKVSAKGDRNPGWIEIGDDPGTAEGDHARPYDLGKHRDER